LEDRLNARIGVLTRREVEARILAPLIDTLAAEFGRDRVLQVVRRAIQDIARQQGAELAETMGDNGLDALAASLQHWKADDALEIEMLAQTGDSLDFNVTRCRYAEMYRQLSIPELGDLLSCGRDRALIEGFNTDVELTRSQTIMEGAPFCDFRYRRQGQVGTDPSPASNAG
jgi:hypothetical protein